MNIHAPLALSDSGRQHVPVMVLLHGFLGHRGDWADVTQLLSAQYRCIAIDLPGHGCSILANESQYSLEAAAQLVVRAVSMTGVKKYHLVGYSMGGRLALYIALHFPQCIETVVLESASPGIEDPRARETRRMQDDELACRLLESSPAAFIEEWYNRPLFESMKRFPDRLMQLKRNRQCLFAGGLAASLRNMGSGNQPSQWHLLPHLTMPTLLLTGEHDNTFRSIAAEMLARNNSIAANVLGDCGHNCHWENPRLFASALAEFYANQKVR